jgi:hypothetical protein
MWTPWEITFETSPSRGDGNGNHISNPVSGRRGNGYRSVAAVHGVKAPYLAVALAVDERAFIHLLAVIPVLDPLHCPVVGAGWVRVQCVQGRRSPVVEREQGGRRHRRTQGNRGHPAKRVLMLYNWGVIAELWDHMKWEPIYMQ